MVIRREPHGLRPMCISAREITIRLRQKFIRIYRIYVRSGIGRDAAKLFNYMTGYAHLAKLSYSPHNIKRDIIKFVEREIDFAQRKSLLKYGWRIRLLIRKLSTVFIKPRKRVKISWLSVGFPVCVRVCLAI